MADKVESIWKLSVVIQWTYHPGIGVEGLNRTVKKLSEQLLFLQIFETIFS
jgi:hypothetical protein